MFNLLNKLAPVEPRELHYDGTDILSPLTPGAKKLKNMTMMRLKVLHQYALTVEEKDIYKEQLEWFDTIPASLWNFTNDTNQGFTSCWYQSGIRLVEGWAYYKGDMTKFKS
jgi:hypothetical protein